MHCAHGSPLLYFEQHVNPSPLFALPYSGYQGVKQLSVASDRYSKICTLYAPIVEIAGLKVIYLITMNRNLEEHGT